MPVSHNIGPETMDDSKYPTIEGRRELQLQFSREFVPNHQVSWTGMAGEDAQPMPTLTTATGQLMPMPQTGQDKGDRARQQRATAYIHGTSAIFAWYISHGNLITVLSTPPPIRFHAFGAASFQVIQGPRTTRIGNHTMRRIEVVHPAVRGAADFRYELWPRNDHSMWTAAIDDLKPIVNSRSVKLARQRLSAKATGCLATPCSAPGQTPTEESASTGKKTSSGQRQKLVKGAVSFGRTKTQQPPPAKKQQPEKGILRNAKIHKQPPDQDQNPTKEAARDAKVQDPDPIQQTKQEKEFAAMGNKKPHLLPEEQLKLNKEAARKRKRLHEKHLAEIAQSMRGFQNARETLPWTDPKRHELHIREVQMLQGLRAQQKVERMRLEREIWDARVQLRTAQKLENTSIDHNEKTDQQQGLRVSVKELEHRQRGQLGKELNPDKMGVQIAEGQPPSNHLGNQVIPTATHEKYHLVQLSDHAGSHPRMKENATKLANRAGDFIRFLRGQVRRTGSSATRPAKAVQQPGQDMCVR